MTSTTRRHNSSTQTPTRYCNMELDKGILMTSNDHSPLPTEGCPFDRESENVGKQCFRIIRCIQELHIHYGTSLVSKALWWRISQLHERSIRDMWTCFRSPLFGASTAAKKFQYSKSEPSQPTREQLFFFVAFCLARSWFSWCG